MAPVGDQEQRPNQGTRDAHIEAIPEGDLFVSQRNPSTRKIRERGGPNQIVEQQRNAARHEVERQHDQQEALVPTDQAPSGPESVPCQDEHCAELQDMTVLSHYDVRALITANAVYEDLIREHWLQPSQP